MRRRRTIRGLGSTVKTRGMARQLETGWRLGRVRHLPEDLATAIGDWHRGRNIQFFCTLRARCKCCLTRLSIELIRLHFVGYVFVRYARNYTTILV